MRVSPPPSPSTEEPPSPGGRPDGDRRATGIPRPMIPRPASPPTGVGLIEGTTPPGRSRATGDRRIGSSPTRRSEIAASPVRQPGQDRRTVSEGNPPDMQRLERAGWGFGWRGTDSASTRRAPAYNYPIRQPRQPPYEYTSPGISFRVRTFGTLDGVSDRVPGNFVSRVRPAASSGGSSATPSGAPSEPPSEALTSTSSGARNDPPSITRSDAPSGPRNDSPIDTPGGYRTGPRSGSPASPRSSVPRGALSRNTSGFSSGVSSQTPSRTPSRIPSGVSTRTPSGAPSFTSSPLTSNYDGSPDTSMTGNTAEHASPATTTTSSPGNSSPGPSFQSFYSTSSEFIPQLDDRRPSNLNPAAASFTPRQGVAPTSAIPLSRRRQVSSEFFEERRRSNVSSSPDTRSFQQRAIGRYGNAHWAAAASTDSVQGVWGNSEQQRIVSRNSVPSDVAMLEDLRTPAQNFWEARENENLRSGSRGNPGPPREHRQRNAEFRETWEWIDDDEWSEVGVPR